MRERIHRCSSGRTLERSLPNQKKDRFGTARRWEAARRAIDPMALRKPAAAYPHNREFWRALASTFVDLHASDVPVLHGQAWDALFDQLDELARYRNDALPAPPFGPFPDVRTFGDLYRAQAKALDTRRGSDPMDAPPGHGFGGAGMRIPRATNADVRALADYWSTVLLFAKDIPGYDYVNTKWRDVLGDVDALTAKGPPTEIYAKRNEFFRELPNVSNKVNEIAVRAETETNANDFIESLIESARHLPERIGNAIDYVGEHVSAAAGKTAHAAGEVLHEVGKGALSGLGTPLLIGAAGIVGLVLLTRRGGTEEA